MIFTEYFVIFHLYRVIMLKLFNIAVLLDLLQMKTFTLSTIKGENAEVRSFGRIWELIYDVVSSEVKLSYGELKEWVVYNFGLISGLDLWL